ncbi:hypothetical protein F4810DRAFT_663091 [Camillea tinctor]|nr:hypothetical protein F4810DRAFT_663091 [Camillea tinctor]
MLIVQRLYYVGSLLGGTSSCQPGLSVPRLQFNKYRGLGSFFLGGCFFLSTTSSYRLLNPSHWLKYMSRHWPCSYYFA